MHYEWDTAKAIVNLRKHGVDFADAVGVYWYVKTPMLSAKHALSLWAGIC
jgi:uncharacterized DUF497 family protein